MTAETYIPTTNSIMC